MKKEIEYGARMALTAMAMAMIGLLTSISLEAQILRIEFWDNWQFGALFWLVVVGVCTIVAGVMALLVLPEPLLNESEPTFYMIGAGGVGIGMFPVFPLLNTPLGGIHVLWAVSVLGVLMAGLLVFMALKQGQADDLSTKQVNAGSAPVNLKAWPGRPKT